MNLVGETSVCSNGSSLVEFDLRTIVTRAIKTQCSNIVLVHSHPKGVLLPSANDVASTRRIANALNDIGITLMDHIIVNEEGTYSMRSADMMPDLWGR